MIPAAPPGATISSILSSSRALGGPYERRGPRLKSFLGTTAERVSREVLAGKISAAQLFLEHSAAPLCLAIQTADGAAMVESVLKSGRALWRPDSLPYAPTMSASLRRCATCVDEDLDSFGFAHARVLHQLQLSDTCHVHGEALQISCANCGQRYGCTKKSSVVALSRCTACGSSSGAPLPRRGCEGSWDWLRLVHRLAEGTAPQARPAQRLTITQQALAVLGGSDSARTAYEQFWGASDFEEACRASDVNASHMHLVLAGMVAPQDFATVVATLAFSLAVLRLEGIEFVGDFTPLRREENAYPLQQDELATRLLELAFLNGVSAEIASNLAAGIPAAALRRKGHHSSQISAFLDVLSAQERQDVEARLKQWRFQRGLTRRSEAKEFREQLLERQRSRMEAILKDKRLTRSMLRVKAPELYNWVLTHDPDWFGVNFPMFQRDSQGSQRASVLALIERSKMESAQAESTKDAGGSERSVTLRRTIPKKLYRWMLRNDLEWFNLQIPPRSIQRSPENINQAKEQLERAMKEGIRNRGQLFKKRRGLHRWLRNHCPQLLDEMSPRRRSKGMTRELAEERVREAIKAGLRSRAELKRCDGYVLRWLYRREPALLDILLPRQHPGGRPRKPKT